MLDTTQITGLIAILLYGGLLVGLGCVISLAIWLQDRNHDADQ